MTKSACQGLQFRLPLRVLDIKCPVLPMLEEGCSCRSVGGEWKFLGSGFEECFPVVLDESQLAHSLTADSFIILSVLPSVSSCIHFSDAFSRLISMNCPTFFI